MKKKFSVRFLCSLLASCIIFYFNASAQMGVSSNIVPPSPNAASIGKFGEIPLNYSSGLPNVAVPLFNLNEGPVSVPVSLSYNYSGYKPYEQPGVAGKGWSLMAGGIITRVVRGNPDERHSANSPNGYLASLTSIAAMLNPNGTLNCSGSGCPSCFNQTLCDGQPDMFYFSFGNTSGKFFFGDDGLPHIVSDRKIRITYKSFNTATLIWNGIFDNIFGFTMTTEDGTIYRFGDAHQFDPGDHPTNDFLLNLKNVEFSYLIDEFTNPGASGAYRAAVSAWYLQEIEDVNGNKVQFTYTNDYKQASGGDIDLKRKRIVASPYNYYDSKTHSTTYIARYSYAVSSENLLTKIQGTNWKVDFDYNDLQSETNYHTLKTATLSRSDGTNIKSYELLYSSTDNNCQLLNLKEKSVLNGTVNQIYTFRYNDLPSSFNAYGIDLWGYYNGVSTNTNLIPVAPFNANRDPVFSFAVMGAMKEIVYPTGASTTFEYEQNQYSWIRNGTSNPTIQPFGGIRLWRMTDIDNRGNPPVERKFSYNVFGNPALSSGVILAKPGSNYFTFAETHVEYPGEGTGYTTTDWRFYRSDPFIALSQTPVYYFNVSELIGNALRTDREFTSHIDYNDELGVNYGLGTTEYGPDGSFDFARSLPKSIRQYRNNTDLVSEQIFTYDVSVKHRARTLWLEVLTATNTGTFQFAKGFGTISGLVQKTSETLKTYYPQTYTKTTSYEYDPTYYVLRKQYSTGSDGKITETSYRYPFDMTGTVYTAMTAKNMISPVIETTVKVNNVQQSLTRNNYDLFNSSNYLPKTAEEQIGGDPSYIKQIFNDYNTKGGLLEEKRQGGISTSYQWGYNNQYPTAKITNAHNLTTTSTGNGIATKNVAIFLGPTGSNYPNPSTATFVQNVPGDVVLQISASVPNTSASTNFSFSLTGPSNKSGSYSCSNGTCNLPANGVITYVNMPAGTYTLSLTGSTTFQSYTFQIGINCSYQGVVQNTTVDNQYFFESFEEGAGNSALNDSHTGHYSYTGQYIKDLANLRPGGYVLTYWQKAGASWTLVSSPVSITGTTYQINIGSTGSGTDDVRFYPEDAQMVTYTYDPQVGVTSMTDEKNLTIYYEYDGFERLRNVRNKDGNIIRHVEYHYQGQ